MKEKWFDYGKYILCMFFCITCIFLYLYFVHTEDNKVLETEEKIEKVEKQKIIIDLKGAVTNPGVYQVEEGQRIQSVIDQHGGLLENADTSSLNLSKKVTDEMLIYIPEEGEVVQNTESSKININTASLEELLMIPGVGETKAKAIISYREKESFQTIEDIQKVNGIGLSTFEKIKNYIMV